MGLRSRKKSKYIKALKDSLIFTAEKIKKDFSSESNLILSYNFLVSVVDLLQEPSIDKKNFLKRLEEEGIGEECREIILKHILDNFNKIIEEEAKKDPDIFRVLILSIIKNINFSTTEIMQSLEILKSQIPQFGYIIDQSIENNSIELRKLKNKYFKRINESYKNIDVYGIPKIHKLIKIKLEDIYIPIYTISLEAPLEKKGKKISTREVLNNHQVVILGETGTGKTTFLKYIALTIIKEKAKEKFGLPNNLLPILISLKSYADKIIDYPNLTLIEFLPIFLKTMVIRENIKLVKLFKSELEKGNIIILFDGLDEIRDKGLRIQVSRQIQNFVDEYKEGNRFIVTSRIAGYMEAQLSGDFKHYIIAEFNDEDIRLFANKWCFAYEEMINHGKIVKDRARKEANKFIETIESNIRIKRLASNPLLLKILALEHYKGTRLPSRRIELYNLCIQTLTETWNLARNSAGIPLKAWLRNQPLNVMLLIKILGPVALWTHEKRVDFITKHDLEGLISIELINNEELSSIEAEASASLFLNLLVEHIGLLTEKDPNVFSFIHETFEEYLVAKYLLFRGDYQEFVFRRLHDANWREVILLIAACLPRNYANNFVQTIIEYSDPYERYLHRNLLLSAWCIVDGADISISLQKQIIKKLNDLIINSNTPKSLKEKIIRILVSMRGIDCEKEAYMILRNLLKDSRFKVCTSTADVLGYMGKKAAIELLIETLKDPIPYVRQNITRVLMNIGAEEAAIPLIEALKDEDLFVCDKAFKRLEQCIARREF